MARLRPTTALIETQSKWHFKVRREKIENLLFIGTGECSGCGHTRGSGN